MPGVSLPNLIAGNYTLSYSRYKLTSASIDPADVIFAVRNYRELSLIADGATEKRDPREAIAPYRSAKKRASSLKCHRCVVIARAFPTVISLLILA